MLLESQAQSGPVNIVLQDDGIHESNVGHHGHNQKVEEKQQENKVSKEEVERRKALMKKIKNRIVQDF